MEVKFWAKETEPDGDKKVTYLLMDLIEYAIENGYFLLAKDGLTASYILNAYIKNGSLAKVDMSDISKKVREEKYNSLRNYRDKGKKMKYQVYVSKEFLNSKGYEEWMRNSFQGTGLLSDWKGADTAIDKENFFMIVLSTDERCSQVDHIKEMKGKSYTEIRPDSVRVFQKISGEGRYHDISKEMEMRDIVDLILANTMQKEQGMGQGVCALESIYQYYETWLRLFR